VQRLKFEQEFTQLTSMDDESIVLAEAALVAARHRYPALDSAKYLGQLDDLAHDVQGLGPLSVDDWREALTHVLFARFDMKGNAQDYYDPRNSYLNDVLERRLGIPITLSVIYLEVAWRAGARVAPVSFPGHFLVRLYGSGKDELFVDPFNEGRALSTDDLHQQLRRTLGDDHASQVSLADAMSGVSKREVLARMFRNLVAIYAGNDDLGNALQVADLAVRLLPSGASEFRTRGLLYWRVGHASAAHADLTNYRQLAPAAPDGGEVDWLLARLATEATAPS
jgi:regulator of sirC expression with transglutaminase-like and TPR domain